MNAAFPASVMPMDSDPRRISRIAGILLLVLAVLGVFANFVVRVGLTVQGDAAATARSIMDSELLFRAGFVADVLVFVCDVVFTCLLYVLLRRVNPALALVAVALRLVMCAILGLNMVNHLAVMLLLDGAGYLDVFDPAQLDALALFFLQLHDTGYAIGGVFLAFHLMVLGYLLYSSRIVPRLLGGLLMAGSLGYLIDSLAFALVPNNEAISIPGLAVSVVAEVTFCFWLIARGLPTSPGGGVPARGQVA